MKPTWGAINREGLKVLALSLDTLGLFARSAEDLKTKTERAMAFLADRLKEGPVEQRAIEADGLKQDFGLKILKEAKKRLRAGSLRRAGKWLWLFVPKT